jgi:hypothetical protein
MRELPEGVRDNPHILRRTDRYIVPKHTVIPRVAASRQELPARDLPEVDPYTEAMFKQEQLEGDPTLEQLRRSSGQLKIMQMEFTNRGDYGDAKAACLALHRVNRLLLLRTTCDRDKGDMEQLINKHNEPITLVQSTTEDWNQLLDSHAELTRSKLAQLADRQEDELRTFDRNVPTDLPPLFKRNSVTYLKMRSKERNLAMTEHFDEAIVLQRAADRVQARDREANFEMMDRHFRNRRNRLQDRQDRIFSASVEYAVMRRDQLAAYRDQSIRLQLNRKFGEANRRKVRTEGNQTG